MSKKNKKILTIWILLYILLTVLNIIGIYVKGVNNYINTIGFHNLYIEFMILYAYVYTINGSTYSKIGIISIMVSLICNITSNFGFLSNTLLHIITVFKNISYNFVLMCNAMVILSLLKKENIKFEFLKYIAMAGFIIRIIMVIMENLFRISANWFIHTSLIINYIAYAVFFAFVILYLIKKKYDYVGRKKKNNHFFNQSIKELKEQKGDIEEKEDDKKVIVNKEEDINKKDESKKESQEDFNKMLNSIPSHSAYNKEIEASESNPIQLPELPPEDDDGE